jgi:hypothetical protein
MGCATFWAIFSQNNLVALPKSKLPPKRRNFAQSCHPEENRFEAPTFATLSVSLPLSMEMMARVSTSDNLYLIQTVLSPKRY